MLNWWRCNMDFKCAGSRFIVVLDGGGNNDT